MLFVVFYKIPQEMWSDTDITELLRFIHKIILAGGLNAKHPVWKNKIPKLSGFKLLELFVRSNL
jgi:hypothetical protein